MFYTIKTITLNVQNSETKVKQSILSLKISLSILKYLYYNILSVII